MSSLTPETLARLHPVHHMILNFLAQSSPYTILQLNKYYRRRVLPDLYHTLPVTQKSIWAFDVPGDGALRPHSVKYAKVLQVVDVHSAILFENYRLKVNGRLTFPIIRLLERPIIPLVKRVEFFWAVVRDEYFFKFQHRMGNVNPEERTLYNEVQRGGQLREALVHVDCSDERARCTDDALVEIGFLFSQNPVNVATTVVLHTDKCGLDYSPWCNHLPLQPERILRFVLWLAPEANEETGSTASCIPAASPYVLEDFAEFIIYVMDHVMDQRREHGNRPEEEEDAAKEAGFVYPPEQLEVVCVDASLVEDLARANFSPPKPLYSTSPPVELEGFEWPIKFIELDEKIALEYDLWNTKL
ncbi:hypothetical protein L198_02467 [Cryptococcus wingfieldii CBS 7118]|uniref:Uncharacterized protein n=1 Tax=Cryptococcus wingfieldii CBS 7118 TaxID=1295528 RepID=A0A1E3JTZ8_9TREE|nr:hypothetical protein L198_02467 [Cryptococcus wingfieldii CBS 7118]ODO03617.1 hypothetical protein L198_02467 [Cryptococcus wingfieldii CBS 7118]